MSVEILSREFSARRTPVISLSVVLAVFAVFTVGISSGLETMIEDLTDAMPDALTAFIPSGPGGYPIGELFNMIAPLILIGYTVMTGAAATAGEERAGTMAVLSAQPVSRHSILTQKALGLAGTVAIMTIVLGATTAISAVGFGLDELTPAHIVAACLHLFLLALFFGGVTLAAGSLTGNPSIAAGIGGGLAVIAWVSNSMLPIAELDAWTRLSPWHYYASSEPLANGVDVTHLLTLAVLTAITVVIALLAFDRRDLKG